MITVYCGEDTAASRKAFIQALQAQQKVGDVQVKAINVKDLPNLLMQDGETGLFADQTVYTLEHLNKQLGRKSAKDTYWQALETLSHDKSLTILIWEKDLPKRQLRYATTPGLLVKESKPDASIFALIEMCTPAQKTAFLSGLDQFCTKTNEMFVYVMLLRHIRSLVMLSVDPASIKLPPWQVGKLKSLASAWPPAKLLAYYDKLMAIEMSLKTGRNAYSIKQSIDILSCYYL